MEIHINWLAVLVATVISLILAKVWYSSMVFGDVWRKLTGITPADSKKVGKRPMVITLFANIVTVVALAAMIYVSSVFFEDKSIWHALLNGLVAWLAFSATTLATHNAFEQKRQKLTLINSGYQLALFLLMAFIIGWFGA
ncbi:MAG TPA: DUF1761 domain-containing protein [Patescibacteria group bacterium]|nr:DUF1761 domain-containing protein [Patescibacteria group bacterium]